MISLPSLGVTFLRRRVREAILQLVDELYAGSPKLGRDDEDRGDEEVGVGTDTEKAQHLGPRPRQLVDRRLTGLVAPIRRTTQADEGIDMWFVSPKVRGHLRLLAGMVLANRPWRLFYSMKSTVAAAFAAAAYVLVMPIIWQMTDSLGWVCLLALMLLAIAAMVVWIIIAHNLWERPGGPRPGRFI